MEYEIVTLKEKNNLYDNLVSNHQKQQADFPEQLTRLWDKIGTHGIMTLSTCADNRVTSRSMSMVVIDGRFYCQTDETYLKCRQISENPRVALCFQNLSVEGVCGIIGKPCEHPVFIGALKTYFPSAYTRWSALPTECVLEITPTLIYSWEYEDDKPFMEYWDFQNRTYRKEPK